MIGARGTVIVSPGMMSIFLLSIVGQIPRKVQWNRFRLVPANDGDLPRGRGRESARLGNDFVQFVIRCVRIDTRLCYFSDHRHALRRGFIHEDRHMRAADESAILKPFLDDRLSFFLRQTVDMDIVDQGKINVARNC